MSDECQNDCVAPDPFPRRPDNRAALARIGYRIGAYPDFRQHLLRRLDLDPTLQAWTHRDPDDPGIALLEGAAVLGDILTFYQDLYANEAYLRTAQWRESVMQLVRLLGYRLRPGLAGSGRLAFEVKGTTTVTVPAGFPLKAELTGGADAVDFETTADLTAYPHLSRFRLYRPRQYSTAVPQGGSRLELQAVAGAADAPSLAAAGLKKGDRLLLAPDESMWTTAGTFTEQQAPQVVTVAKVTTTLGRVLIDIEGSLADAWTAPVTAYRIGRTFHHFGYNAPVKLTVPQTDGSGNVTGTWQGDTEFRRHLAHDCGDSGTDTELSTSELPLDQEVHDLSVGGKLVITGLATRDDSEISGWAVQHAFCLVRTITSVGIKPLTWGNLSGSAGWLTIEPEFFPHNASEGAADIRTLLVYEVLGPALTLRAPATFDSGAFDSTHQTLCFYGTQTEALALAGRALLWQNDVDGTVAELTCTSATSDFDPGSDRDATNPWMWSLAFDALPAAFALDAFDETAPTVTVFGNLADADQGKTEKTAVLGNGDGRQRFQTFKLPKAPLTFHTSATATPPEVPALTVRVNGREWRRVDSLFGHGPDEEIYVVREDAAGASYVQFGDGETGARLPSGLQNVTAAFRTGNGGHGEQKPETKVQAGARLERLQAIQLPGIVGGSAVPEHENNARQAAPGKVQTLGRMVSLADYEAELLTIGGIARAAAAWQLYNGVPAVVLTVLLEAGRADEFSAVRTTIAGYQRSRGPNRFPVVAQQGFRRFVYLDITYAFDPTLQRTDVEAALQRALGLPPDDDTPAQGLFALAERSFGGPEYASRIEGTLQAVTGVTWCKVTAFGLLDDGDDPTQLTSPADPKPLAALLSCADDEILQLDASHLTLTSAAADDTDLCADS